MAEFDKNKSEMAKKLGRINEAELFNRYFIADESVKNDPNLNDKLADEYNTIVDSQTGNNLNFRFIYNLAPKTSNALASMLATNILSNSALLGYKLNTYAILEDFEKFLKENPKETVLASSRDPKALPTEYLKGLIRYFRDDLLQPTITWYVNNSLSV